jgi:hypothetical protein
MIPKPEKCTKQAQNVPNGHKICNTVEIVTWYTNVVLLGGKYIEWSLLLAKILTKPRNVDCIN